MPQERPKQLDSPLLPKIFKFAGKAHVWVYRRTDGKVGGKWRIGAGFHCPNVYLAGVFINIPVGGINC